MKYIQKLYTQLIGTGLSFIFYYIKITITLDAEIKRQGIF